MGLEFEASTVSLAPGEAIDVAVYATDGQGEPQGEVPSSDLSWTSSDREVATVEAGTVHAHETGEARVTATHPAGPEAEIDALVATETEPPVDALFHEDWSSGDFRQWDDGPSRPSTWNVIEDPDLAYTGRHVLEVEVPANEDGGYLGAFHDLAPGSEEIHVRARVRLGEEWDGFLRFFNVRASNPDHSEWPWHALGGAGQCPRGDDRVRVGVTAWDEDSSPESTLRWYNYWHGMWPEPDGQTCWGRHSPDRNDRNSTHMSPPPRLPIGEWFTLELHVELNDAGRANGSARMWLDGELQAHWQDEEWRTSDALLFNIFQMDLRGRASHVRHVYFDDIVVRDGRP